MRPRYRLVLDGDKRWIFDLSPPSIPISAIKSVDDVRTYFRDVYVRGQIEEHRVRYGTEFPGVSSPSVETIDVEMQEFDGAPFVLVRRIKGPSVTQGDCSMDDKKCCAPPMDMCQPMRQDAAGCLRAKAERLRKEAAELDDLAERVAFLSAGSPAESAMWKLINSYRI